MDRHAPLIVVCANQAWNLVNFREGLIRALIGGGFRVLAVAPGDPAMEARLAAMGCGFASVPVDAMGLSPWRDLRTFLALWRVLRQHRPAAFLGWTIKPNVYGALAARLCGVASLPNVSGLGTAFIREDLLTRIVRLLYRAAFRKSSSVFFQNEDDRGQFLALRLVTPQQARLLPGSGVDPAHWSAPTDKRPAQRRFLMIARVVADKGVREFVEAARLVRHEWSDARFRLMGPLGAANRTAIPAEEVRGWEAEGIIEYVPPADDVRGELAEAAFVVLPSYREGLSRVLLEAAAMGRPIITTDVPGCRDVVREGENGYLCAPRDAASLAEALGRACRTSDARWQKLSRAGRARVVQDFSLDRVTALYLEALKAAGVSAGR